MRCWLLGIVVCGVLPWTVWADGPADNNVATVRQIPPPGIEIPEADRTALTTGMAELQGIIERLKLRRDALTPQRLPDVEIFSRAVQQALEFNELYSEGEIKQAHEVLAEGLKRARQLQEGQTPWETQTGLVVRGYRSRIDGTVQPYGLVIPETYKPGAEGSQLRCDLWFHGRGEKTLEVQFIAGRMKSVGQIQPTDTIVLHPFGRYSNAFKFAGEVDVWEALAHAQRNYRIDRRQVAVRGFSMGGAGAWHFAVHYPTRFFAANPGAGFSETPEFLKSFQNEQLNPPAFEETLWQMYDCPVWVENLKLIPTVAYSGELDRQKQAADIMEAACKAKGMELIHIIGPQTEHKIHPDSLVQIEQHLRQWANNPPARPQPFTAVTATLKYNRFDRLTFLGLEEHWKLSRATVDLRDDQCTLTTEGVTDLALRIDENSMLRQVTINGTQVAVHPEETRRGLSIRLHKEGNTWASGAPADDTVLQKRHDLQGPIDDAFMGAFLIVTPSGQSQHAAVQQWVTSELAHAQTHWRQHFRGDARVKSDQEVTPEDIANHNLVLFGTPQSNSLIAKVLPQLPLEWTTDTVKLGEHSFPAASHVPVLIYPNPLNRERYVVLNSGFTFREYDYLNNARQTPKLPDWAIMDITTPANARWAGKIAAADFFGEQWEVKE